MDCLNPGQSAIKLENVEEKNDQENDINEPLQNRLGKSVFKMDMDKVIEKIEFPFRKVKDNLYLVAMNTKEEIEKVVSKIQSLTKVTWSVKQTRKFDHHTKKPLTLFKRTYGCHMSTRCRIRTKKIRNKKSRNINCPAQLLVTVRRYTPHTRSKFRGPLLDEKYPCSLEFRNHHNHKIDAAVLNTRPLGEEIKDTVLKLLNKGHSCASAYHTLYTIKVEEYGPDYKTKMTDRHNFPKKNDISSLWKSHNLKEKAELHMDFSYTVKNLEEMLSSYQKKNGTLYRVSVTNHVIVIFLCTPLMQRTIQQVSEILFIESTGEETKEYKMYFILTQATVGALPIGCIITNSHSMTAFNDGMRLFLQMIQIQPTVVLTNNEIMKELIIHKFFPNSKIMYSFYHALSSAWKLLYDARHEIVRTKKESYYQLFREVVFADSEEGLVVARQVLAVECAQPKFLDYIDKMYEHITLWCLLYRQYIVLRGVDTFNYNEAETSFRLFRLLSKIPLERTKLFNLTQITDYMSSAFEKYYKTRIMEMVLGKESKVLQEKYGRIPNKALHMDDIGHHQFIFKKITEEILNEYYQVDMITNMCTCAMGVMGKYCDHISEVLKRCKILSPSLTIEQKAAYYFVATGVLKHKNSFLPNEEHYLGDDLKNICCSPETILGPESDAPNQQSAAELELATDFENTKNKWISYCNKIVKFMEKDPAQFLPAVKAHLKNVEKYTSSVPVLLKGLYAGFPYKGDEEKLPPLTIISNKVSAAGSKKNDAQKELRRIITNPAFTKPKTLKATNNATKCRKKKLLAEEECNSPWNNFSSVSNSPVSFGEVQLTDEDSEQKMAILDEKDGILVEQQSEIDEELLEPDVKLLSNTSVDYNKTLTLNQLSNNVSEIIENKNLDFRVEPGQFEDISRDGEAIFDMQKAIYMDQVALNQLTECDIAVLDEKKGILIIPVQSE